MGRSAYGPSAGDAHTAAGGDAHDAADGDEDAVAIKQGSGDPSPGGIDFTSPEDGYITTLGEFEDFEQIAANQTTFTALSRTGQVWTWGDGRYESCLGREVYDER